MLPLDSSFWWTLRKRTPQGTALEPHRFHGQSTNSESFHQPETNWTKLFPWNFTKHLSLSSPWTFSSQHTQSKGGVNPPCFFFGSLPFSTGPLPKVWCSKHPRPESPPKKTIPNCTCRLVRYLEELSFSVGYGTCIWGFQSYFLGELALRFPWTKYMYVV